MDAIQKEYLRAFVLAIYLVRSYFTPPVSRIADGYVDGQDATDPNKLRYGPLSC